MSLPKLTLALSNYDRHLPLLDGTVGVEGFELEALAVDQTTRLKHGAERHERMLQKGEFDAAELSLSSYLMARSRGMPFTAIPVFPRRLFSQSQMWINAKAGIEKPRDLVGRKVGLNTFQTTLSVLAKGDLQAEYGAPWREIQWYVAKEETVEFEAEEGVSIQTIPAGKKIADMLDEGQIDALLLSRTPQSVIRGSANVQRLFPDPRAEEVRYFEKNGFYPIMHCVAFKNEVLERYPEAARALFDAFEKAKEVCRHYYDDPNWSRLVWGRHWIEEEKKVFGDDSFPNGVRRNRANLERFLGYSKDQGLLARQLSVEELFAEAILDT